MGFMEEVIADMAGHIPLAAIGDRVLREFASDQFGDFKVGLRAARSRLSVLKIRKSHPPNQPNVVGSV